MDQLGASSGDYGNGMERDDRYIGCMTAMPLSLSSADARRPAVDEVNRWRGHCTDLFARIESEATDVIEAFYRLGLAQKKRPALFGQKLALLDEVVASGRCGKQANLTKALAAMADDLKLRNMLVHGVGTVFVANDAEWIWRGRYRSNGAAQDEIEILMTKASALDFEKRLSSGCRRLRDLLANMVRSLAPDTITAA